MQLLLKVTLDSAALKMLNSPLLRMLRHQSEGVCKGDFDCNSGGKCPCGVMLKWPSGASVACMGGIAP